MRGGKREGAGRPTGAVNRSGEELRELAKQHTETAIDALVRIIERGTSDGVKLKAIELLLDRAYGKPTPENAVNIAIQPQSRLVFDVGFDEGKGIGEEVPSNESYFP